MSLEIKNIKFSKHAYEFGFNRDMELEFEVVSSGKNYNLNGIYIEHGIKVAVDTREYIGGLEKLSVSPALEVLKDESRIFYATIPIRYPNKPKGYHDFKSIEISNYVKITADICFNPFNVTAECYPIVKLNEDKIENYILENSYTDESLLLADELESLIAERDELRYNELEEMVIELNLELESGDIGIEQFDSELTGLIQEQDLCTRYSDENRANEIRKRLSEINYDDSQLLKMNNNEKQVTEQDENFIIIDDANNDSVRKDVHRSLMDNFFSFRMRELLRNNDFFMGPRYIAWFIVVACPLVISLMAVKAPNNSAASDFLAKNYLLLFGLILVSATFIIADYTFRRMGLDTIKKLIKVNFGNAKDIKNKMLDLSLSFSDIIKDAKILYEGTYDSSFEASLICFLRVGVVEGYGKNQTLVDYEKNIYKLNLGYFFGKDLSYANIIKFNTFNKFADIRIPLGYLYGKGFFVLKGDYGRIMYKVQYSFTSSDLMNKSETLIIE